MGFGRAGLGKAGSVGLRRVAQPRRAPARRVDQRCLVNLHSAPPHPPVQVVDRATIERHLLSDPTDPFNRCAAVYVRGFARMRYLPLCPPPAAPLPPCTRLRTPLTPISTPSNLLRAPLAVVDLVPQADLAARIAAWRAAKAAKREK